MFLVVTCCLSFIPESLWQPVKPDKPTENYKTKYIFSTHMANRAAEAVWRGKFENVIEYHKGHPKGAGYLRPPQKAELGGRTSHSTGSESEEKQQNLTSRDSTKRGIRGGMRGRRGRGGVRGGGSLRRSRRIAVASMSEKDEEIDEEDEDEEEDEMDGDTSLTRSAVRKRQSSIRSPQPSSSSAESSDHDDKDTSERPPKQSRYSMQQQSSFHSPLSSPRSDVSHEDSPEAARKLSHFDSSFSINEGGNNRSKSPIAPAVPNPTPQNVKTPDSTQTPVQQPSHQEVNYTIRHDTSEMRQNKALQNDRNLSKEGYDARMQSDNRQTRIHDVDDRSHGRMGQAHQPNEAHLPQSSEKHVSKGTHPISSQAWSSGIPPQFVQGGYPYNPKLHPMAYHHTHQGMTPGNYPYSLPYPWPHPPHPSHHPIPEQMRGQHYQQVMPSVSSPQVAGGTWSAQTQRSTGPQIEGHKTDPKIGYAQKGHSHMEQVQHQMGVHPGHARHATQSPGMQFVHPTQSHVEGASPFQYGFEQCHPSLMWQSHQMPHAQLHSLMPHAHLAPQGLWYPQHPHHHPQMTMGPPNTGNRDKASKNKEGNKVHHSDPNTNNNQNNNNILSTSQQPFVAEVPIFYIPHNQLQLMGENISSSSTSQDKPDSYVGTQTSTSASTSSIPRVTSLSTSAILEQTRLTSEMDDTS